MDSLDSGDIPERNMTLAWYCERRVFQESRIERDVYV